MRGKDGKQNTRNILYLLACFLGFQPACSSPASDPSPKKDVQPETVEDAEVDAAADLQTFDLSLPDTPLDCPGAAGCDCQADGDCNSGLCTEAPDGKRCGVLCGSGCPAGTVCRTANTAGEPINYCAPVGVRQCAPCLSSADCNAPWSAPAVCASGGSAGSFCASTCTADADCPSGLKCQQVEVSGGKQLACAPPAGIAACTCNSWAIAYNSTTACDVAVGTDLCPGSRSCSAAGLGECTATPGAACVDAGCKDAKDSTACDDGDPCTQSECQAAVCTATTNLCQCQTDGACQDDANLCNGAPFCDKSALPYTCKTNPATVVHCGAAEQPCTALVCQPITGKCLSEPADEGKACNDGDPCFANKTCLAGQCQGGLQTCPCIQTSDCAEQENGNLCDGTLFCDLLSHTCKVNPVTVVKCQQSGNPCEVATCLPATGKCVTAAKADAAACEDGAACTIGDYCQAGQCMPGTVTCDCAADADCAAYEDGNSCNGKLFCNKAAGKCQVNPKTVVQCPSGLNTECQINSCEPATGACSLSVQPTTTLCEDGNPCSGSDHCDGLGKCTSNIDLCPCDNDADCADKEDGDLCNGTLYCELANKTCQLNPATVVHCPWAGDNPCAPVLCQPLTGECHPTALDKVSCDDGDPCTALGLCQSGTCAAGPNLCQCQTAADCEPFDDENPCNGNYYCDVQSGQCKVNPASIPICASPEGNCTTSACSQISGKCEDVLAVDGTWCTDGEPCTKNETCKSGTCKDGTLVCACLVDSDCAGQEDGNLCNGLLVCDRTDAEAQCVVNPLSLVTCEDDGNVCAEISCEPKTGTCVATPVSGPCSDESACTVGDFCETGGCLPGAVTVCDDQNACTDDACSPGSGCLFLVNMATCSDGDACAEKAVCDGGICQPEVSKNCDDGNPCTNDSCDLASGCVVAPNSNGCNDGSACTTGDQCSVGACVGAAIDCDDGFALSIDSCNPFTGGCKHLWPETCDGSDNDSDGLADNVVCGSGACTCAANGVATCPPDCSVCPYEEDLAIPIDDAGDKKVVCAHDYPAWGVVALAPATLSDNNDGTISDSLTGLQWQKSGDVNIFDWAGAKAHCDNLTLSSKQDWRLPTQAELETLVDYATATTPTIAAPFPADTPGYSYWSATPVLYGAPAARSVSFYYGSSGASGVNSAQYVRCVR